MNENRFKITTGEAAEIVRVHESSIKRWCDVGDLEHDHTTGGHRRVRFDSLLDYAGANGLDCDLLLFGNDAENAYRSAREAHSERFGPAASVLYDDVRDGRVMRIAAFLRMLMRGGTTLERALDEVVAPVLHRVGCGWRDGTLGIGDEHRMSAVITDVLYELRPSRGGVEGRGESAVIGCMTGNRHDIGANMARMILEAAGWRVVYLGADVPLHDLMFQQRASGSSLIGIAMAPPQVATDVLRMVRVLAGMYHNDTPYRLAIGGKPAEQVQPSDLEGLPFADCRAFVSLDAFTKWL